MTTKAMPPTARKRPEMRVGIFMLRCSIKQGKNPFLSAMQSGEARFAPCFPKPFATKESRFMTNIPCPIPAEIRDFAKTNVLKAAEQGLTQSRAAFDKLNAASKDAAASVETSYSIASKGVSEFNAKSFEALQANVASAFDFFNALSGVKSLPEAATLQQAHARKQVEALTAQTKDLTALAQKIVTASVEPLKAQIGKNLPLAG